MQGENLFVGESYKAQFARIVYKRLISREWVTYADIIAEHRGLDSTKGLKLSSPENNYGELKKAFPAVKQAISRKLGCVDCFEEEGDNRKKRFRYVGNDDDPLAEMRMAKTITDIKQYWTFCQDSAGFFPVSWLEHFFRETRDLLEIEDRRSRGEQVLSASLDRMLTNIDFVPLLYEAIVNKYVLSVRYKPFTKDERQYVFHPHFIKEFNGRWFVFGHADGQKPEFGFNIAIDRIVGRPTELPGVCYVAAQAGFYEKYLKDIVGVTCYSDSVAEDVYIRAHDEEIFGLTETKKLHHSQETVRQFDTYEDGEYGEFKVRIKTNKEFYGQVLSMGAGLEIVAPERVREEFKKCVDRLAELYK